LIHDPGTAADQDTEALAIGKTGGLWQIRYRSDIVAEQAILASRHPLNIQPDTLRALALEQAPRIASNAAFAVDSALNTWRYPPALSHLDQNLSEKTGTPVKK